MQKERKKQLSENNAERKKKTIISDCLYYTVTVFGLLGTHSQVSDKQSTKVIKIHS